MKKPTRKQLTRRITVDDIGTTYIVGELSKEDLQILVCLLADDLEELQTKLNHYEEAYNGGRGS